MVKLMEKKRSHGTDNRWLVLHWLRAKKNVIIICDDNETDGLSKASETTNSMHVRTVKHFYLITRSISEQLIKCKVKQAQSLSQTPTSNRVVSYGAVGCFFLLCFVHFLPGALVDCFAGLLLGAVAVGTFAGGATVSSSMKGSSSSCNCSNLAWSLIL